MPSVWAKRSCAPSGSRWAERLAGPTDSSALQVAIRHPGTEDGRTVVTMLHAEVSLSAQRGECVDTLLDRF